LYQIDIIFIAELVETLWFAMNPDEAAITNLAGEVFLYVHFEASNGFVQICASSFAYTTRPFSSSQIKSRLY
jgi:hypothetical protein